MQKSNLEYDNIIEIYKDLVDSWGESGKRVVENAYAEYHPMNFNDFLNECSACGGNWGGMLLTGMKKLYPKTYEAIPEQMGYNAFALILNTLYLLGVTCE